MKVINRHHLPGKRIDPRTQAYIGRGTPFGNPFEPSKVYRWNGYTGLVEGRAHAVSLFESWWYAPLNTWRRDLAVKTLMGKDLVCSCAPRACHGDVILTYLQDRGTLS